MSDREGPITPGKDTTPDRRDRRMAELEAELKQARAENAALKARIAELERRLAELERAGNRQATPFARDEHKADPKKPVPSMPNRTNRAPTAAKVPWILFFNKV